MSKYFIKAILLDGCPYSINANNLIMKNNIPNESIWVSSTNKEVYKTDQIQTFPQIYLCKKNKAGTLLLGGYNDLNNIYNLVKFGNGINIDTFMPEYKWAKKSKLRLIELISK
jgi:hypothetical protein